MSYKKQIVVLVFGYLMTLLNCLGHAVSNGRMIV